jgi:hypothetical protein
VRIKTWAGAVNARELPSRDARTLVDGALADAGLIAGETRRKLPADIPLEHTHILTPDIHRSAGLAYRRAEPGVAEIALGAAADWTGGFVDLAVR